MNCHEVGQQTMDNLNRQTRSTPPKPLFSVMRLSKSKLFWTAMGQSGFICTFILTSFGFPNSLVE